MPFLYARRAIVNTYYSKFDPKTGSFATVSSSIMNEYLAIKATEKRSNHFAQSIEDGCFGSFQYSGKPCIEEAIVVVFEDDEDD